MCVTNIMVDGEQCTIVWHVYDLKNSHKDPKAIRDIIDKLEANCEKLEK